MLNMKTETHDERFAAFKSDLVTRYGADNVWNTDGIRENYSVETFLAPYCIVTRKSDGKRGTLEFTHQPRFYYNFIAD